MLLCLDANWHISQEWHHLHTSLPIPGQEKCLQIFGLVFLLPRCPPSMPALANSFSLVVVAPPASLVVPAHHQPCAQGALPPSSIHSLLHQYLPCSQPRYCPAVAAEPRVFCRSCPQPGLVEVSHPLLLVPV